MTWLAYFTMLAALNKPAPEGCSWRALDQGSGAVLVCKAGRL